MNFNRKYLVLVAVVAMLALAGCAGEGTNNNEKANEIANSTGEDIEGIEPGGSYTYEIKMTEKNQMGLVKAQPPFQMDSSLERENLIRRYQYLNDENNVHHVYAYTESGQIMGYWVAQGKVSSVNSKLTNDAQIVASEQCIHHDWVEDEGNCFKTVESPQMDGSYGTNGDAIFFFTTSGKYVEYNGKYIVSEEPMNIQSQVVLTQEVDTDGNSTNSTDE